MEFPLQPTEARLNTHLSTLDKFALCRAYRFVVWSTRQCWLECLPDDVLCFCLAFLPLCESRGAQSTCRRLQRLTNLPQSMCSVLLWPGMSWYPRVSVDGLAGFAARGLTEFATIMADEVFAAAVAVWRERQADPDTLASRLCHVSLTFATADAWDLRVRAVLAQRPSVRSGECDLLNVSWFHAGLTALSIRRPTVGDPHALTRFTQLQSLTLTFCLAPISTLVSMALPASLTRLNLQSGELRKADMARLGDVVWRLPRLVDLSLDLVGEALSPLVLDACYNRLERLALKGVRVYCTSSFEPRALTALRLRCKPLEGPESVLELWRMITCDALSQIAHTDSRLPALRSLVLLVDASRPVRMSTGFCLPPGVTHLELGISSNLWYCWPMFLRAAKELPKLTALHLSHGGDSVTVGFHAAFAAFCAAPHICRQLTALSLDGSGWMCADEQRTTEHGEAPLTDKAIPEKQEHETRLADGAHRADGPPGTRLGVRTALVKYLPRLRSLTALRLDDREDAFTMPRDVNLTRYGAHMRAVMAVCARLRNLQSLHFYHGVFRDPSTVASCPEECARWRTLTRLRVLAVPRCVYDEVMAHAHLDSVWHPAWHPAEALRAPTGLGHPEETPATTVGRTVD